MFEFFSMYVLLRTQFGKGSKILCLVEIHKNPTVREKVVKLFGTTKARKSPKQIDIDAKNGVKVAQTLFLFSLFFFSLSLPIFSLSLFYPSFFSSLSLSLWVRFEIFYFSTLDNTTGPVTFFSVQPIFMLVGQRRARASSLMPCGHVCDRAP